MPWYTYILRSIKSGKHYIGSTNNIERRLQEHNSGKTKSTRNKGPWEIIYTTEKYKTKIDARKRELKIKSYKGGKAFKKLVQG